MSAIDSTSSRRARSLEQPNSGLSRVSPIRGVLARLLLLFFLAHPGSAATFGDTRRFLLSRYPNRDVVPSALLPASTVRRRVKTDCHLMLGFVTTLPGNRMSTSSMRPAPQPFYGPAAAPVVVSGRPTITTSTPAPQHAATSRPVSPPRCRPCNVVVGDFVSSLERRRSATSLAAAGEVGTRSSSRGASSSSGSPMQIMLGFAAAAPVAAAQAATGSLGQAGDAAMSAAGAPLGLIRGSSPSSSPSPADAVASPSGPVLQADFWRRSTAPIMDAYDNVVSFVGSSLARGVLGGGRSSSHDHDGESSMMYQQQQQLTRLTADLQGSGSSLRYDLVGFIDLDPFEKSRRYFKRNTKINLL